MTRNLTPEQLGWTAEAAGKFLALFRSSSRPYQFAETDVLVDELLQRPEKEALLKKLLPGVADEEIKRLLQQSDKPNAPADNPGSLGG